jgi:hypothetical protein
MAPIKLLICRRRPGEQVESREAEETDIFLDSSPERPSHKVTEPHQFQSRVDSRVEEEEVDIFLDSSPDGPSHKVTEPHQFQSREEEEDIFLDSSPDGPSHKVTEPHQFPAAGAIHPSSNG